MSKKGGKLSINYIRYHIDYISAVFKMEYALHYSAFCFSENLQRYLHTEQKTNHRNSSFQQRHVHFSIITLQFLPP